MHLDDGVSLDDDLVQALIECGRRAHSIAQAHHSDPGSNSFTFGTDRYHRATELARPILEDHHFAVTRRGAGLIARRQGVELQFATARGSDLSDPGAFDPDSSPGRRRAGESNAFQGVLPGMPEFPAQPIVHLVWSGSPADGLTAIHLGKLISAGDRLRWAYLRRVDAGSAPALEQPTLDLDLAPSANQPAFTDQPVPPFDLTAHASTRSRTGRHDGAARPAEEDVAG